jgi:hypothetical protein
MRQSRVKPIRYLINAPCGEDLTIFTQRAIVMHKTRAAKEDVDANHKEYATAISRRRAYRHAKRSLHPGRIEAHKKAVAIFKGHDREAQCKATRQVERRDRLDREFFTAANADTHRRPSSPAAAGLAIARMFD